MKFVLLIATLLLLGVVSAEFLIHDEKSDLIEMK